MHISHRVGSAYFEVFAMVVVKYDETPLNEGYNKKIYYLYSLTIVAYVIQPVIKKVCPMLFYER